MYVYILDRGMSVRPYEGRDYQTDRDKALHFKQ